VEERVTDALCEGVYVDFDTRQPPETIVVTYGRLTASVLAAKEQIDGQVGVVLLGKLRPWGDTAKALADLCKRGAKKLVFCEEGIRSGGFAMTLATDLATRIPTDQMPALRIVALDNDRITPDPKVGESIFDATGIGEKDILRAIQE
jgi:deoxyxylulose-5-phosphate synthase